MTYLIAKPAILNQIPSDRDCVIEASAGTGKTFTIAHLVVDLVLRGVPIEQILIVTFTEKATGELKQRIRQLLTEVLAKAKDVPPTGVTADRTNDSIGDHWLIGADERLWLAQALRDYARAAIQTIHGFCNRVLGEFAFEHGQLLNFEQKNQTEIWRNAFPEFIRTQLTGDDPDLRVLLDDCLGRHPEGLALEPSSNRFAWQLFARLTDLCRKQARVIPDAEAAKQAWEHWCSFVPKHAWVSLLDRMNLKKPTRKRWLTMLAQLQQIVAADLHWAIGLSELKADKGFQKFSRLKESDFLKTGKAGFINRQSELPEEWCRLEALCESLRPFLVAATDWLSALLRPQFQDFVATRKAAAGWIDFDDMIRLVSATLSGDEAGPLRSVLRERYRYALIDEFQDTDQHQWTIFRELFLLSDDHQLILIGDPKQAIYGFRGADIQAYLDARGELLALGGQRLQLSQNFRSSAELIACQHQMFGSGDYFSGGIDYDPHVTCGRPELGLDNAEPGAVRAIEWQTSDREVGSADQVRAGIADWIAAEIQELLEPNGPSWQGQPLKPNQIAILLRDKKHTRFLEEALRRRHVPFAYYKKAGLFQTEAAGQWLDMLEAIRQPRDERVLLRALMTDFFGLSMSDLTSQEMSVREEVRGWFLEWHERISRYRDFRALFDSILAKTRVLERMAFQQADERALTDFEHLAEMLTLEGRRLALGALINWLRALIERRADAEDDLLRLESERASVQLMTIHASKGLEFPIVFLYGGWGKRVEQGPLEYLQPGQGRVIDLSGSHKEAHRARIRGEAERLYYVAVTRAILRLYTPYFPNGKVGGDFAPLNEALQAVSTRADRLPIFSQVLGRKALPPSLKEPRETTNEQERQPSRVILEARNGTDHAQLEEPDYAGLRERRNRLRLSSYSRMVHRTRGESGLRIELQREPRETDEQTEWMPTQPGGLPGSREVGLCLHDILEASFDLDIPHCPRQDRVAWLADAAWRSLVLEKATSYRLAAHVDALADLAWRGLATEILPKRWMAQLSREDRLAEVNFHLAVRQSTGDVFLNGAIDVVFRCDGRVYFGDWKSDTLSSYDRATLADKVWQDYGVQVQIYLTAVLRWLNITSERDYESLFGGFAYLFLRGMDPANPGSGCYVYRPSWQETKDYWHLLQNWDYR